MKDGQRMAKAQERLEQIALATGHVVIEFNKLEVDVSNLIGTMLDSTDTRKGEVVCSRMRFLEKLDLAAALFDEYSDDEGQRDALQTLLGRAAGVNGERNALIHSEIWLRGLDPAPLRHVRRQTRTTGRKGFKVKHENVEPAEIMALSERISDLGAEIYHFDDEVDWSPWQSSLEG